MSLGYFAPCPDDTLSVERQNIPSLPPRVMAIIRETCAAHGISLITMFEDNRRRNVFSARAESMARIRNEVLINGQPPSYPLIGRWFGRDHTTVMNALGLRAKKRARAA